MESEFYREAVGTTFRVISDYPVIELELINYRELPARGIKGLREESFAILFRGPPVQRSSEALPRQIHELEWTDGSRLSIYLEPVVSYGQPGILYEAIFD
jgi:uncharacterized protein DUF6916